MADVIFKLDADMAKAVDGFLRVVEAQKKTERGFRRVKKGAEQSESSMSRMAQSGVAGIMRVAAVVGGLGLSFREVLRTTQEFHREVDMTVQTVDRLQRQVFIQAGLEDPAMREAVFRASRRTATPTPTSFAAATALISEGAQPREAVGAMLEEVLLAQKALQAAEPLARPFLSYAKSQGMPLTAATVKDLARRSYGLYQHTAFQAPYLTELAKVGATLKGADITPDMQLALLTLLAEAGTPAAEAATGLKTFALRSRTMAARVPALKALRRLGLSPENVDLVGEGPAEVLGLLSEHLRQVPAEERMALLKGLYEERGAATVMTLLAGRERLPELVRYQRGEGYAQAVRIATSGPAAARVRMDVERERLLNQPRYTTVEDYRRIVELGSLADNALTDTPFWRAWALRKYDMMTGLGISPEWAMRHIVAGDRTAAWVEARRDEFYAPYEEQPRGYRLLPREESGRLARAAAALERAGRALLQAARAQTGSNAQVE